MLRNRWQTLLISSRIRSLQVSSNSQNRYYSFSRKSKRPSLSGAVCSTALLFSAESPPPDSARRPGPNTARKAVLRSLPRRRRLARLFRVIFRRSRCRFRRCRWKRIFQIPRGPSPSRYLLKGRGPSWRRVGNLRRSCQSTS